MFIQTELTPNPATVKFIPGVPVAPGQAVEITGREEAARLSPLAERLFRIPGVRSVFLGHDFVSVSKEDTAGWPELKAFILAALMDHFVSGLSVLNDTALKEDEGARDTAGDSEIVVQIKELINTRVRPAVMMDGGDIVFERFDGGVVYLQMRGACAGCPSSTATLKHGIENMLRHFVPEVTEVRQSAA